MGCACTRVSIATGCVTIVIICEFCNFMDDKIKCTRPFLLLTGLGTSLTQYRSGGLFLFNANIFMSVIWKFYVQCNSIEALPLGCVLYCIQSEGLVDYCLNIIRCCHGEVM